MFEPTHNTAPDRRAPMRVARPRGAWVQVRGPGRCVGLTIVSGLTENGEKEQKMDTDRLAEIALALAASTSDSNTEDLMMELFEIIGEDVDALPSTFSDRGILSHNRGVVLGGTVLTCQARSDWAVEAPEDIIDLSVYAED